MLYNSVFHGIFALMPEWGTVGLLLLYSGLLLFLSWKNQQEALRQQNWTFTGEPPTVLVLVALRNEENNLETLLNALARQDYPTEKWELILVDDHSTDGSRTVFDTWLRQHPNLPFTWKTLPEGETGKKAALEFGAQENDRSFRLYTDADCEPPFHWISDMVKCQQNMETDMVCGGLYMNPGSWGHTIESLEFAALIATSAASLKLSRPSLCNAANYLISKEAVLRTAPFRKDQHLAGGDDVFLLHTLHNTGGKIGFCRLPLAGVRTEPQSGWGELLSQRLRWASKWKSGLSGSNKRLAVGIWVLHVAFLMGEIGLLFQSINLFLLVFAGRTIAETIFLEPFLMPRSYGKNSLSVGLLQLPYSAWVAAMGLFVFFKQDYQWKDRRIKF